MTVRIAASVLALLFGVSHSLVAAESFAFQASIFYVLEGREAVISVVRLGSTNEVAAVRYDTVADAPDVPNATANIDYVPTNGILTFSPGQATNTFSVSTIEDNSIETGEAIGLRLSDALGSAVSFGQARLAITDDDTLLFDRFRYVIREAQGPLIVSLFRSGSVTQQVTTVAYSTATQPDWRFAPALAGVDYTSTVGTLEFAAGDTVKTITIPIHDRGLVNFQGDIFDRQPVGLNGDRMFSISLRVAGNEVATAEVVMQDNERAGTIDTRFEEITPTRSDPDGGLAWIAGATIGTDGSIVIFGNFDHIQNLARPGLARFAENGRIDPFFIPDLATGTTITSVAAQLDRKAIVGGSLATPGCYLKRLNADGSADNTFQALAKFPGEPENLLSAGVGDIFVMPTGKIYVRCFFISDDVTGSVFRLNADGSLDSAFVPFLFNSSDVSEMQLTPEGLLLLPIRTLGSRTEIVRLNEDGTRDTSFTPLMPSIFRGFAVGPEGRIYLSGYFHLADREGSWTARLNPDGSLDKVFDTQATDTPALATSSGVLYLNRSFCFLGCSPGIFRLRADGSNDPTFPMTPGRLLGRLPNGNLLVRAGASLVSYVQNPLESRVELNRTYRQTRVSELDRMTTVVIERFGDSSEGLEVKYSTEEGTAKAGVNFVAQSGTITFAPLDTDSKVIQIPILKDGATAGPLTFRVLLSNPQHAVVGLDQVTIEIGNADGDIAPAGQSWKTVMATGDFRAGAYGNGVFVAADERALFVSANGSQWRRAREMNNSGKPATVQSMAFGKGRFVAVGYSFGEAEGITITSVNGEDWMELPALRGDDYLNFVSFLNGRFIGFRGNSVELSEDGLNWTRHNTESVAGGTGAAFGNGKYALIKESSGDISLSLDGIHWASQAKFEAGALRSVAFGNGRFVAVGPRKTFTSEDGLNWTPTSSPHNFFNVVYSERGSFIGTSDAKALVSTDGLNWEVLYTSESWISAALATQDQIVLLGFQIFYSQAALRPRLQIAATSGLPSLHVSELENGGFYSIQASSDLTQWSELISWKAAGGILDHADSGAAMDPRRFYRVLLVPSPR